MPFTLLTEPLRYVCKVCGGMTELKGYVPCDDVCFACTLKEKENGHRQTEKDKFAVHFRPFEPS